MLETLELAGTLMMSTANMGSNRISWRFGLWLRYASKHVMRSLHSDGRILIIVAAHVKRTPQHLSMSAGVKPRADIAALLIA